MFLRRCLFSALSSVGLAVLWALYILALEQRLTVLALVVEFALPWLSFLAWAWWVDEESWRRRAWLTLSGALGGVVGTAAVILWF